VLPAGAGRPGGGIRHPGPRYLDPPLGLSQPALLSSEAERRIEIDWQESEGETFVVRLAVGGEDRRGLYADICTAISESGTNIRSAEISTRDGAVFGSVLVEVENQTHLNKVIRAIRRVKGVMDVSRRESGPRRKPPSVSFFDAVRPRISVRAGGDQPRAIRELTAASRATTATRRSWA